tara:strand:+ start:1465 stop:2298 length:834 start_codon:yes stop_codon:yes gene_type:complete
MNAQDNIIGIFNLNADYMRISERLVSIEGAAERVDAVVEELVRGQLAILGEREYSLAGVYPPLVADINDAAPIAAEAVRTEVRELTNERDELDREIESQIGKIDQRGYAAAVLFEVLRMRMPYESLDHVPSGFVGRFSPINRQQSPEVWGECIYLFKRGSVKKHNLRQLGIPGARITFRPNEYTDTSIALMRDLQKPGTHIIHGNLYGTVDIYENAQPGDQPRDHLSTYDGKTGFAINQPVNSEEGNFNQQQLRDDRIRFFQVTEPMMKAAQVIAKK